MSNKILVTGATGNLGSEIVRQLSAKGESVRAAVRNPGKARDMGLGDVMLVHWDYKKQDSFAAALENADRVVLVAPSATPNQTDYLIPAMDAAKAHGIKHIVMNSVMGADATEDNPLRLCEKHLQALGPDYTIIRPNWFMQNFSATMAPGIQQGNAFYVPAGDGKTSFIDTRDIAAVVTQIFADNIHRNKEYVLTGPAALDHNEVAKILSDVTGKQIAYNDISEEQFTEALKGYGMSEEGAAFMTTLYGYVKAGYTAATTDDVKNILGRDATSFEQFAKDHASVWK